jgi:hypothetical protein
LPQLPQALIERGFIGTGRFGQERLHGFAGAGTVEQPRHCVGEVWLRGQQAAAITGTTGNTLKGRMDHGLEEGPWIKMNR